MANETTKDETTIGPTRAKTAHGGPSVSRYQRNLLGKERSEYIPGLSQREALREYLMAWGISDTPPPEDILESIMDIAVRYDIAVDELIEMLDTKLLYANRQRERTRPRFYTWFITTAANHYRVLREQQTGLVKDWKRNDPAEDDARTDCF